MSSFGQQWSIPAQRLRLLPNEVHVWKASLRLALPVIQQLQQSLSLEEVIKARKFFFEKDRNSFIVARGLLRKILSSYLDIYPDQVRFRYNSHGKPALDLPSHGPTSMVNFNLSHSHELVLYAFTCAREIGIDVEYMRSDIEYEQLAQHSFSPNENVAFHALPKAVKLEGFYNCWTRKEAYIKARGQGLSLSLDLFDVTLRPGEPAALVNSREDPQEPGRWLFHAISPDPGYAGAVAVEGHNWMLRYFCDPTGQDIPSMLFPFKARRDISHYTLY